jgi:hypothetical protein
MRRGIQLGAWIILGGLLTLLSTLPVTWAMPAQKLGRSTMPTRTPEVGVIATMTPEAAAQAQLQLPEAATPPNATATAPSEDTVASPADGQSLPPDTVTYPNPDDVARGEDQQTALPASRGQPTPPVISEGAAEDAPVDVPATGDSTLARAPTQRQRAPSTFIAPHQIFTLQRTLGIGLLIIGSIVIAVAATRH